MLNDLLFVAFFFITRIILPIAVTYAIGVLIERALNRAAPVRPTRTVELTEPRTEHFQRGLPAA